MASDHNYNHEAIDATSSELNISESESNDGQQFIGSNATYVISQQGGKQLKIEKYLHRLHDRNKKYTVFKCIRGDCKCRVKINENEEIKVITNWHNHSDDRLEIGKRIFRKKLKDTTRSKAEQPLDKIHTLVEKSGQIS